MKQTHIHVYTVQVFRGVIEIMLTIRQSSPGRKFQNGGMPLFKAWSSLLRVWGTRLQRGPSVARKKPLLPSNLCAGFMTSHELKLFESLHSDFNKYWMPLTWFSNLASQAREEGRVRDDIALKLLMDVRGFLIYNIKMWEVHV